MVSAFLMLVLTAPGAQLDYGVAPGLRGCPDEAWIRSAVSARLGRDPFSAEGEVRVVVRISQAKAPALVGQVELTRADGRVGRRSVESETGDCMELASALELAVSLALDPLTQSSSLSLRERGEGRGEGPSAAQTRGEPQPASAQTAGPETPPLVTPLPNPLPLGGEGVGVGVGVRGHLRVGPALTAGGLPGFGAGLLLGAGFHLPNVRVTLEARVHAPGTLLGDAKVTSFLALGSVVPCIELGRFAGCAVGSIGALRFQLGDQVQTTVMAQAGLRVEVRFEPLSGVFLTPFVEGAAVLTRTSVYRDGVLAWLTWPASVTGGVFLELKIPS